VKIRHLHEWDLTPEEAKDLQNELVHELDLTPHVQLEPGNLVLGVDNSYLETAAATTAFAAAVVMTWPELEVVEVRTAEMPVTFPYIPGLLTFRELPVLVKALREVEHEPRLIFSDGHGIAHPRGIGIAAHLGLLAATPTIGIAKRPLRVKWTQPGPIVGDTTPLLRRSEVVGYAVRTRATRKDPVFVSPGNLIRVEDVAAPVLEASGGAYLPRPQQAAHDEVSRLRKAALAEAAERSEI
jgi:deoxyribonuclease V